jgi:hypothetical protein
LPGPVVINEPDGLGVEMPEANPLPAIAIPDTTALAAVPIAVAARLKGVAAPVRSDGSRRDYG